jgi:hypothetical protein
VAYHSLSARPLLRNDISTTAQLFEVSFDHYLNDDAPFYNDYLRALRTLAGLGFTASLADYDLLSSYQTRLKWFLDQHAGDFKGGGDKKIIAQLLSEMLWSCSVCFSALQYPSYFEEFAQALGYTMAKIPRLHGSCEHSQEAGRIIHHVTGRVL